MLHLAVSPPGISIIVRSRNFAPIGSLPGGIIALDQQQLRTALHRLMTVTKNRERLLIIPIVNDMPHQVRIRAGRNFLEEVAADESTASARPAAAKRRSGPFDNLRKIVKDLQRQDCSQRIAMSFVPLPPPMSASIVNCEKS